MSWCWDWKHLTHWRRSTSSHCHAILFSVALSLLASNINFNHRFIYFYSLWLSGFCCKAAAADLMQSFSKGVDSSHKPGLESDTSTHHDLFRVQKHSLWFGSGLMTSVSWTETFEFAKQCLDSGAWLRTCWGSLEYLTLYWAVLIWDFTQDLIGMT